MNKLPRLKIFLFGSIGCSLLTAVLYSICMSFFDADTLYYNKEAFVLTSSALLALFCILFIALSFMSKDTSIQSDRFSIVAQVAAILPLLGFSLHAIILFVTGNKSILTILTAICALSSALFFAQLLISPKKAIPYWGIGVVLFCAFELYITYTDLFTPLNSPIKLYLQFELVCIMLFVLSEMRRMTHTEKSHLWLISASLCAIIGQSCGIPFLIFYQSQGNLTSNYALLAFISLASSLFALSRIISVCNSVLHPPMPIKEPASEENIETQSQPTDNIFFSSSNETPENNEESTNTIEQESKEQE